MAWTAPRTYVDGEIITHTTLNTDIRDNLSFLDNHIHNNASGQGSSDLQGIDTIGFGDQGQDPAAATMQRNGASLFFHNAGSVVNIGGVSAAATASLRVLGTVNGTQGAPGTHTHVFTTGSSSDAFVTDAILPHGFGSMGTGSISTSSPDIHTTGSSMISVTGFFATENTTGSGSGSVVFNGTLIGTVAGIGNDVRTAIHGVVPVGSGTFNGTINFNPTNATAATIIMIHAAVLEVGTPS